MICNGKRCHVLNWILLFHGQAPVTTHVYSKSLHEKNIITPQFLNRLLFKDLNAWYFGGKKSRAYCVCCGPSLFSLPSSVQHPGCLLQCMVTSARCSGLDPAMKQSSHLGYKVPSGPYPVMPGIIFRSLNIQGLRPCHKAISQPLHSYCYWTILYCIKSMYYEISISHPNLGSFEPL